jgi:hypothetical protein
MVSFVAEMRNGSGHVLATEELPTLDMIYGEQTGLKGGTVSAVTAPRQVDHVRYVINHTMTEQQEDEEDRTYTRVVTGGFQVDAPERDATVQHVGTNVSAVYRGDTVYVNGTSQGIANVSVDGQAFDVDTDGGVSGWVTIPDDIATGEQTINYSLATDNGVYTRNITVNVSNRPPSVTLDSAESIKEGTAFEIAVETNDDTGITTVAAVFQDETYAVEDGAVTLPTEDLSPGAYDFTVRATDVDGAETTQDGQFLVVAEEEFDEQNTDQQEQNGGQAYSENTSFLISIVNGIRGFFESLLFG